MVDSLSFSFLLKQLVVFCFLAGLAFYIGKRFYLWKVKETALLDVSFVKIVHLFALWLVLSIALSLLPAQWVYHQKPLIMMAVLTVVVIFWSREQLPGIWKANRSPWHDFLFGAASWLVVFPIVGAFNAAIRLFILLVQGHYTLPKQDVMLLVEQHMSNLWELLPTLALVICIVPVFEEIAFRAVLQSWLRKKLGPILGLPLSAGIFAAVHYTRAQGVDNIEILLTLLVLSSFLTLLYEKKRSLWVSIGLHTAFNTFSVLGILIFGGGG